VSLKGSVVALKTTPKPSAEIERVLKSHAEPVLAVDIDHLTITSANSAAYDLLDRAPNSLEGTPVTDLVSTVERLAVQESVRLLASGAITGYRATRHIQKADGTEFITNLWVRLVFKDSTGVALLTVEPDGGGVPWAHPEMNIRMAIAVTDHDWVIEHISTDIESILGSGTDTHEGSPFLGLLQPGDVPGFMLAVGRVEAGNGAATLRAHLRDGQGRWQAISLLVVTMCRHSPPRLGLAFAVMADPASEATSEGHRQVAWRGVDALNGMDRHHKAYLSGEKLSTRQWEILTRLMRGQRVDTIAGDLYLSPSTVRNHLTAIYKKFGVHSQAELLGKFLVPS
jgi:DNA-binding CsgD family transcriptional regulator